MRNGVLSLAHGALRLPAFLPDATLGVVRAVDSADLEAAGIQAVVMNVFHLMQKPGSSTIQALGGLHKMAAWPHPIVTDSGGFQAYSLIRQNPKFGKISDQGITFQPESADRKFLLTPEKSVQLQMAYGADIVICLDDCTHVDAPLAEQQTSVTRTIKWARRCKAEYERQLAQRKKEPEKRPLLFAVVQGGGDVALRRQCAEALLEIGFDGFGYGGWPLDSQGKLLEEILAATRALIPAEFPLHALGVGHPENVLDCARLDYGLFDSALPTRDARTGRLYTFTANPNAPDFRLWGDWFAYLYIDDEKHIKADTPLFPGCDCHTCRSYAVGYLRHLHKSGDTLFFRLATIHNLRFMTRLMDLIGSGA
ncbi:MAG TPA: tRNA guanosine(34) transglycosylase Tgt [Chthonomonadaceae bacterium]|nr:tRNA guanosine(34) transglycosylase Tgt [Chthonomonadaceae bacterium]